MASLAAIVAGGPSCVSRSSFAHRLLFYGSPQWVACWADEGANLELKRICQGAYYSHWHLRVLGSWRSLKTVRTSMKRLRTNHFRTKIRAVFVSYTLVDQGNLHGSGSRPPLCGCDSLPGASLRLYRLAAFASVVQKQPSSWQPSSWQPLPLHIRGDRVCDIYIYICEKISIYN